MANLTEFYFRNSQGQWQRCNIITKKYENIDFSKVPTKAMIKYTNAYMKRMPSKYSEYKNPKRKRHRIHGGIRHR